jgi:TolB-like protein
MKRVIAFVVVAALAVTAVWYWRRGRIAIPASPIVVVTPAKVSGAPETAFFADAVASALTTQLAGIPAIEIKQAPTSTQFDQVAGNAKRVSLAYDANLVVIPSITVDGDYLNLDLQLLDPVTESALWSGAVAGSRGEYLELIHRAGEALRQVLRPASPPLTVVDIAGGAEAELAFREGEFYADHFNTFRKLADFEAAFKMLNRALELNSKLADAAAGIARLYSIRIEEQGADAGLLNELQSWTRKALDIDPHCGRAYFALATADPPAGRLPNALRAALYAPDYGAAHLTLAGAMRASSTLGLAASREARQTEPLFLYAPVAEAGYLHQLGRTSEAFGMLDRHVLSIDPRMSYGRLIEASLMIELGWLDRAEPIFKALAEHASEADARVPAPRELRQRFEITQKEFGIRGLDAAAVVAMVKNPQATPLEVMVALESVPTLANGGHIDDSFQVLERALQMNVIIAYDWLKLDRRLERLRKDGRLGPVVNRAREQFEQLLKDLDEAKRRGELPEYLEEPISQVKSQVGS